MRKIEEIAKERSINYKPFEENLPPQSYYERGFIDGANYKEQQLKNCNLHTVSNNEVSVCDHEFYHQHQMPAQCHKCGALDE